MSTGRYLLVTCVLGVALGLFCVGDARGQIPAGVRRLLPDEPPVVWHVQANLDSTPDKEWVVLGENYAEGQQPLWIFRQAGTEWIKAFEYNAYYCPFGLELRDLDGDGSLEVWWDSAENGALTFGWVDFVDGKFRCAWGPCIFDAHRAGLLDIDGDRTLEVVVTGTPPGYLAAVVGDRWRFPWWDERSSGERDLLIYRFVEGKTVLYFPPLATLPEGLSRGLASGYRASRAAAAEAARVLRVSGALPRLLALVNDPKSSVACAAIDALVRIGGPLAAVGIITALEDEAAAWWVRLTAAEALAELDDERAVRVLLELRNSEHPELRCIAVQFLSRQGGPEAVEDFCRYLQDDNEAVREAAVEALGCLGGREAADALAELLDDSRPQVQVQAARTLAALGDSRATSALIALIEQGKAGQRDFLLLGELGDKSAVPVMLRYLASYRPGEWPEYREEAVRALCQLDDQAALDQVADIVVHTMAEPEPVWVLGPTGWAGSLVEHGRSQTLVDCCLDYLNFWDFGYRLLAAEALGKLGDPSAIPALRKATADAIPEVAEAAKWALVEIRGQEALPLLLEWSRAGDNKATARLAEMEGEEVEKELLRALRENHSEASRWGETMGEDGSWVPGDGGWFRTAAHRLGKPAVPILIARLQEVAPWEEKHEAAPEGEEGCVAVAAAHCLRELGAVEAIPALLKVADSHPIETAREVARWSVVALRRQGATWQEPLFPEIQQQPLETYLGPGGPWRIVDYVIANLDSDPEAEFVIAYRDREKFAEAPETLVEKIVALDWQRGEYVATQSLELEEICGYTEPLQLRDVHDDGVPEVLVEGKNGRFPVLAIFGWHDRGLRLLGWFEGYKVGQLLADLDGDGIREVLSGFEQSIVKDLLVRLQAEHLHHEACMWELWQWNAEAGEYEQVTGSAAVGLFSLGAQDAGLSVREPCVEALGWLKDEEAVPILIEALDDEHEDMRGAAICALARIGGAKAAVALRRTAKSDPDERVRTFAQQVLQGPK